MSSKEVAYAGPNERVRENRRPAQGAHRHDVARRLLRDCHTSFLDIDERIFELVKIAEFDRSPITDIKHCGPCDIALIEGGVCNAENVHVLREMRANAKILVAIGTCAITGGLPAMRNCLDIGDVLNEVYRDLDCAQWQCSPNDPELPLLLNKVYPVNEIVRVDYFIPGRPPSADAIWKYLNDLILGACRVSITISCITIEGCVMLNLETAQTPQEAPPHRHQTGYPR